MDCRSRSARGAIQKKEKKEMSYHFASQMTMDFVEPGQNYRNTDPETSKTAGKSAGIRAGSQRHSILLAYFAESQRQEFPTLGLTDEEAGNVSGLSQKPKCCYWKRCSELRELGLIIPNGEKRNSSVNELQMVCIITNTGISMLKKIACE